MTTLSILINNSYIYTLAHAKAYMVLKFNLNNNKTKSGDLSSASTYISIAIFTSMNSPVNSPNKISLFLPLCH